MLQDAEEAKGLAALRTRLFDDDPGTTHPRRKYCGQPATCDRFRQGVNGCQGCLHTGGDLMPEASAEAVVSRRLLELLVRAS